MTLADLVGVEGSASRARCGTYQRAFLSTNDGANAYVVKPEIDSLIQTITQFVGQAETVMAQVVPFRPNMSFYPNFTCGPLAA